MTVQDAFYIICSWQSYPYWHLMRFSKFPEQSVRKAYVPGEVKEDITLDSTSDCKIRCNVRGDVSWNYKFRILGRSVFVESQIAFGPLQVMINGM